MLDLGTIDSDTIESARVWLDHAKGLPFSQFLGEWGFVSLHSSSIVLFIVLSIQFSRFHTFSEGGVGCYLTVRALVFVFRRNILKLQPEVTLRSVSLKHTYNTHGPIYIHVGLLCLLFPFVFGFS